MDSRILQELLQVELEELGHMLRRPFVAVLRRLVVVVAVVVVAVDRKHHRNCCTHHIVASSVDLHWAYRKVVAVVEVPYHHTHWGIQRELAAAAQRVPEQGRALVAFASWKPRLPYQVPRPPLRRGVDQPQLESGLPPSVLPALGSGLP